MAAAAAPGLGARGRIVVDYWGIPHIYAASERDAFFLQGYNAARDRLWQIDLWRKRGLGLLSASLGPAYVAGFRHAPTDVSRGYLRISNRQPWSSVKCQCRTFILCIAIVSSIERMNAVD